MFRFKFLAFVLFSSCSFSLFAVNEEFIKGENNFYFSNISIYEGLKEYYFDNKKENYDFLKSFSRDEFENLALDLNIFQENIKNSIDTRTVSRNYNPDLLPDCVKIYALLNKIDDFFGAVKNEEFMNTIEQKALENDISVEKYI